MKHIAEYPAKDLFAKSTAKQCEASTFERKRDANKIIKRAIRELIEIGYSFSSLNLDGQNEVWGYFGDRGSTHLGVQFKSIMDCNRRRYPNKDHILFERTMATLYKCSPTSLPRAEQADKIDHIKFKGVAPRKRLARLHALGVAKLLE